MAAIKNLILSLKLSAYQPSSHLLYLNIKEYRVKTLPRLSYWDFLHLQISLQNSWEHCFLY